MDIALSKGLQTNACWWLELERLQTAYIVCCPDQQRSSTSQGAAAQGCKQQVLCAVALLNLVSLTVASHQNLPLRQLPPRSRPFLLQGSPSAVMAGGNSEVHRGSFAAAVDALLYFRISLHSDRAAAHLCQHRSSRNNLCCTGQRKRSNGKRPYYTEGCAANIL